MVPNLSVATLLFNCVIKHIQYKRKQENLQHQLLWKEGIPYYMMVLYDGGCSAGGERGKSVAHINVILPVMLHSCYGWQTALDPCV